ncbi:MAG: VWA domain-containing protein [Cytophagales bacterium]|nr:MAG: VWA domain-containing protein [Cytophagales bacterium]
MKNSLVTLFCFYCLFFSLKAQNTAPNAIKSLNIYIDYCNETIHPLWMVYEEVESFNQDLNGYYQRGKSYFSFDNQDVWSNPYYYEIIPEELYQQCINDTKTLTNEETQLLHNLLKNLKESTLQIQSYRDSISLYIQKQVYTQDQALQKGYHYLEQMEYWFDEYDQRKEKLVEAVRKIYQEKYLPQLPPQNQWLKTALTLDKGWQESKKILDDLDKKDSTKIINYITELDTLINTYQNNMDAYLQTFERYGENHGHDPYLRYKRVLSSLNAISTRAKNYLSQKYTYYPSMHGNRSKIYYYYNSEIINKYNRYGAGLIDNYNQFVDLADIPLLHAAEEPHQYKVLYPEKKQQQEQEEPIIVDNPEDRLEGYPSNHLVFLLDVSSSMNMEGRLPLLKKSFEYLMQLMRPEDYVGIITYSGTARIAMQSTSAAQKKQIISTMNNLSASGSTNAKQGLQLAYQLAQNNFIQQGNNRVLLATDGDFTIDKNMEQWVKENKEKGIKFTIFLFGENQKPETIKNLKKLAQAGEGNFIKITTENMKKTLIQEAQNR